jgi:hypothetical protein
MGITVEEYLKERKACAACESTDHEQYCVTHMLSRPDNCLIYNAVNYSGNVKKTDDMRMLQNLRATPGAENTVLDYYMRAEPLVKKIKSRHGESAVIWNQYYKQYVQSIIQSLREDSQQQAHDRIIAMLVDLESQNL